MSAEMNRCPRCGAEAAPGTRYCAHCGYDFAAPPSTAPPGPSGQWQSSEGAKARVIDIVNRRGQTDTILSEMWILLPILAVVAVVVLTVAIWLLMVSSDGDMFAPGGTFSWSAWFFSLLAVGLASFVLFMILNYKLLKRQYEHIAREAALRRALIDFFRAKAEEKGAGGTVYPYVQAMEAIDREGVFNEKQRDPLLWTLVLLIPVIGTILWYYSLWFLTEYTPHHDRRWFAFSQNVQYAGAQLGMRMNPPRPAVPERSTILYLIITVLIGIFAIYWYWVIIKDYNEHFKAQWEFEDQVVREIQRS